MIYAEAKLSPIDSMNMWPLISGQTSPCTNVPANINTSNQWRLQDGWTGPQYDPNLTNPHGGIRAIERCGDTSWLLVQYQDKTREES